ncbi:MAG: SPW repeat protein [Geminicoccaceae bacterium]
MARNRFMTQRTNANRWQDWTNLILAIWLFISPWVLQFASGATTVGTPAEAAAAGSVVVAAAWNAWIFGVVVAAIAAAGLLGAHAWEEWTNLLIGLWLVISPWVLGFSGNAVATWNTLVVGLLIFALAAWELYDIRKTASATSR